MSALERLGHVRLQIHEDDKKAFPDRHRLTKDSYLRQEMLDMCVYCCEHYEWLERLEYDARTDKFYKVNK